ncbi:MAG TPA: biotin/lipoyl-containing protein [Bryocella sp.]|nr:biotin/lipoyl-containing protein [Bryocella sp.]
MKLTITINGKSYDVEVEEAVEPAALEPSVHPLPLVQSSVLPTAAIGASSDFDESKVVRSPLAGVVTRLEVKAGAHVKANQLLLLLEAMKMEIKIAAHAAGTVKSIEVAPSDAVRPDQVLVCLE